MIKVSYDKEYDVIIVGGGHAGCEAALAVSRMGLKCLMLTMNLDTIAQMSCNPAIGGMAKGHIVREIDALGGEMAKVIDNTGIQFRLLNTKKGPAVQAPRAQADKKLYQFTMKKRLEDQEGLDIKQEIAEEILIENGKVYGVDCRAATRYKAAAVIVTTGTFLNGLIYIGLTSFSAGRMGEFPSVKLSDSIRSLGFDIKRLKTGTPARINKRSIDLSRVESQFGDPIPTPFSFSTGRIGQEQIPCYVTYTNPATHKYILENLDRSPLYSGRIKGIGPRYCPSIEDKVVRFKDKERHQIFLEPEGLNTNEIYLNGLSTSLPQDVQVYMLRTVKGLENSEIMRFGYAIEYDFCPPTQIKATLETKLIENLYFAGQINGTSGYEEAAAQGLMAGINSVLKIRNDPPFVLDRSEAYIGVLIDDLVTKGTEEPYRMFTSRAEYRLLLRHDNADTRLMEYGFKFGFISTGRYDALRAKNDQIRKGIELTKNKRRGEIAPFSDEVKKQIDLEIKYEGYIKRQLKEAERLRKLEKVTIPPLLEYNKINGIRKEALEKLDEIRPVSIGQASRISGVSPCDISMLYVYLEGLRKL